ncbi:MAG: hypothetical protein RR007_03935 [Kiritimatiellia bacterium]
MFFSLRKIFPKRSTADRRALQRGHRRMCAGRGAVYLEFALLAPLFLAMLSMLVELATLWDATVMANHTAWTVGRMVKVKSSKDMSFFAKKFEPIKDMGGLSSCLQSVNNEINAVNRLNNQANVATVLLMSTCTMGSISSNSVIGNLVEDLLIAPSIALLGEIKIDATGFSEAFAASQGGKLGNLGGMAAMLAAKILGPMVDNVIGSIATALLKPAQSWLSGKVSAISTAYNKWLNADYASGQFNRWRHYLRRASTAAERIGARGGDVIKVSANTSDVFLLDYPVRCINKKAKGQSLRGLTTVTVTWPVASDWLFPVFGSSAGAGIQAKKPGVCAVGSALVMAEPEIANKELDFAAPVVVYKESPNEASVAAIDALKEEMGRYLKRILFFIKYRLSEESLTLRGRAARTKHVLELQAFASGKEYIHLWEMATRESWTYCCILQVTLQRYARNSLAMEWLKNDYTLYRRYPKQAIPYVSSSGSSLADLHVYCATVNATNNAIGEMNSLLGQVRGFLEKERDELQQMIDGKSSSPTLTNLSKEYASLSGNPSEAVTVVRKKWEEKRRSLEEQLKVVNARIGEVVGFYNSANSLLTMVEEKVASSRSRIAALKKAPESKKEKNAVQVLQDSVGVYCYITTIVSGCCSKLKEAFVCEVEYGRRLELQTAGAVAGAGGMPWEEAAQKALGKLTFTESSSSSPYSEKDDDDGAGDTWTLSNGQWRTK